MNMKKEEFLKTATAKIYNFNQKQKIKAELTDHIETKESFYIEIGYSKDAAEEKALTAMGNAEEICNDLSKLYNRFYNPVPDIIAFAVWFGILGILYLFFNKYVFDDLGTTALCASGITFTAVILFTYSLIGTAKKNKYMIIGNIIGCFANAVFNLFCLASIDKNTGGSLTVFNSQVLGNLISDTQADHYNISTLIAAIVILIITITVQIPILSCILKTEKSNNSLKTNSILKAFRLICGIAAIFFTIISAVFITRFAAYQNNIKDEYIKNYHLAMEIAEQCETWQQVSDFIADNEYNFKENRKDNLPDSYTLDNPISRITLQKYAEDNEEEKHGLERLTGMFIDSVMKKYPETLENKNEYSIQFSAINLSKYKNGADSVSLIKLKSNENSLDEFYNYEAQEHTSEEALNLLNKYCPSGAYILPSKDKNRFNTFITLTYTAGTGENAYDTDFSIVLESEKYKAIKETKQQIISAIKNNPDISKQELAETFHADITKPDISYTEYIKYIDFLESSIQKNEEAYEELKNQNINFRQDAEKFYDILYSFKISEDLSFNLLPREFSDNGNAALIFFSSNTNIEFVGFEAIDFSENEENKYNAMYLGNFRKIYINDKCFSMKGYAYSEYENLPYYTKSGSRYRFVTEQNEDGNDRYYLKNIHGDKHEAYYCYTDKDGYLVFDDENTFRKIYTTDSKITEYQEKKGNKYIKALETNWDTDGSLLDYNKYYN